MGLSTSSASSGTSRRPKKLRPRARGRSLKTFYFRLRTLAVGILILVLGKSGIRVTEKTADRIWLKFGYVIVRPRYSGGRHRENQFLLTEFFLQAPKVGKSPKSLFLALIFFLKIHPEAPLGFGTLKFGMNMLIACI